MESTTRYVAAEGFVALPQNANTIGVLKDGETHLEVSFTGWGPNWQWLGFNGPIEERDETTRLTPSATARPSGAKLTFDVAAKQIGLRRLQVDIGVRTDQDTDLTLLIASVQIPAKPFSGGRLITTLEDGTSKTLPLPLGLGDLGQGIKQVTALDAAGRSTTLLFSPACALTMDGDLRLVLAAKHLKAAQPRHVTLTIELPEHLTYYPGTKSLPSDPGFDDWYTFQPSDNYDEPSEIDLSSWLEAPAGKHGRILRKDDDLIYNGRPLKLWGLNVCYASCAPERELAEKRAKFYAKYGVNSVRLHKYADGAGWAGIQSQDSFVEFDAAALDRMDRFVAEMKERGIYTLLSSTFGVKLGVKDRRYVPYIDEFGTAPTRPGARVQTKHGSVFLSRELQDLQIRQVVRLLEHKNPYTGLTYAEDPAIAVVELFNEDSALFFGTLAQLQNVPTLRKRAAGLFHTWLKAHYGTKEKLLAAWGSEALNSFANEGLTGESWEEKTIVPAGNPWFYDPAQLAGSQKSKRRRLLDTMRFLYDIQNDFYDRYVAAIRKTGYEGEILGSNWQAGRAMSHYYNLHSDYRVGMIDRHNYFGGGDSGKIDNVSMLRIPGSGMLSAGMQQVADRPFMLSEWIHVAPNEWGVEGPAIIGAYGMGLQGWDVSYMFQNRDTGGFAREIGRDRWEVTTPQVLGVFPAVARQVLRGDIRQSEVAATRSVHIPSMSDGKLGFEDKVTQQHDVKTFNSDAVPVETLAVARSVVEFSDTYRPTEPFDISRYEKDGQYTSTTGQLRWHSGRSKLDGHFTINTDATKAVVGFAEGRRCELGDVTIAPKSRFGAIYVTAQQRDATIDTAKSLLVVAVARSRNTGMKVFNDSRLLERGTPPVVMEPVAATISVPQRGTPTVHLLDHAGRRTGKTLPTRNATFNIDGARDKTCYYWVTFGK